MTDFKIFKNDARYLNVDHGRTALIFVAFRRSTKVKVAVILSYVWNHQPKQPEPRVEDTKLPSHSERNADDSQGKNKEEKGVDNSAKGFSIKDICAEKSSAEILSILKHEVSNFVTPAHEWDSLVQQLSSVSLNSELLHSNIYLSPDQTLANCESNEHIWLCQKQFIKNQIVTNQVSLRRVVGLYDLSTSTLNRILSNDFKVCITDFKKHQPGCPKLLNKSVLIKMVGEIIQDTSTPIYFFRRVKETKSRFWASS